MATCRNCGYNFPPSDLSPNGLCECCEEDDEYEYDDDDEGSCDRCGRVLRSQEIEICTECARDIDGGDDAWDYDDEEDDYEICD